MKEHYLIYETLEKAQKAANSFALIYGNLEFTVNLKTDYNGKYFTLTFFKN